MKLEVGKYYKTRDGRKVGPSEYIGGDCTYTWNVPWLNGFFAYSDDGKSCLNDEDDDIISEWPSDGPVRTVTRKEIVPGVYGKVEICEDDTYQGGTGVYINSIMSAPELRAAVATLIEIADALEDGKDG